MTLISLPNHPSFSGVSTPTLPTYPIPEWLRNYT